MGNQADRPTRRLILVKHGKPVIEPDRARSDWPLSDGGREAAVRLATKLIPLKPGRLLASPETKAADTARAMGSVLGLSAELDTDLAEHRADENPFVSQADFEANVERLFREPQALVMGEETGQAAHDRFAAAMARIEDGPATQIVVAHGRIITLWLSRRLGFAPMPFWRALGLGHAVVLTDRAGVEMLAP